MPQPCSTAHSVDWPTRRAALYYTALVGLKLAWTGSNCAGQLCLCMSEFKAESEGCSCNGTADADFLENRMSAVWRVGYITDILVIGNDKGLAVFSCFWTPMSHTYYELRDIFWTWIQDPKHS